MKSLVLFGVYFILSVVIICDAQRGNYEDITESQETQTERLVDSLGEPVYSPVYDAVEKRDFIPEETSNGAFASDMSEDPENEFTGSVKRNDIEPVPQEGENLVIKSDFESEADEYKNGDNENSEDSNDDGNNTESGSGSGGESGDSNEKRNNVIDDEEAETTPQVESESGGSESGSGIAEDAETEPVTKETESGSGSGETVIGLESGKLQEEEEEESNVINKPSVTYDAFVSKRDKIPKPPRGAANTNDKRQYISRPRFVIRNGYVYMKAPPMTQKTIVTTHIPRPPMVMPYNTFMRRYHNGYPYAAG